MLRAAGASSEWVVASLVRVVLRVGRVAVVSALPPGEAVAAVGAGSGRSGLGGCFDVTIVRRIWLDEGAIFRHQRVLERVV